MYGKNFYGIATNGVFSWR